jgi:hypothetical protein
MGPVLPILNRRTVKHTINEKRIIDPAKPPDLSPAGFSFLPAQLARFRAEADGRLVLTTACQRIAPRPTRAPAQTGGPEQESAFAHGGIAR